jgi:hypothetical protein
MSSKLKKWNIEMTTQQPEALRLAELLESDGWPDAAAELRRLHAENASLRDQNTELDEKLAELERVNAQLLEALEGLERYSDGIICYASTMGEYEPNLLVFKARAAIAAAKGEA